MSAGQRTKARMVQLRALLADRRSLLIVVQDYPDPDAVASAAALRQLAHHWYGIPATLAGGGIVGRAENQALLKYLQLRFHPIEDISLARFDCIAMVDTQPQTGNNSLPPDVATDIVIDHHPICRAARSAPFHDVRSRYGSNSTILYEYLTAANAPIDAPLSTALVYGIRSDTQDLGRDTHQVDIEAMLALYPTANKRELAQIERSDLPRSYFQMLAVALRNARIYESCVIASIGEIAIPDIAGEIADLLLRYEPATWALCYGFYEGQALLSLRTSDNLSDAGKVMRRIIKDHGSGGGHKTIAGGRIPLGENTAGEQRRVENLVKGRLLRVLKIENQRGSTLT